MVDTETYAVLKCGDCGWAAPEDTDDAEQADANEECPGCGGDVGWTTRTRPAESPKGDPVRTWGGWEQH